VWNELFADLRKHDAVNNFCPERIIRGLRVLRDALVNVKALQFTDKRELFVTVEIGALSEARLKTTVLAMYGLSHLIKADNVKRTLSSRTEIVWRYWWD
jgi:hypothetical protein